MTTASRRVSARESHPRSTRGASKLRPVKPGRPDRRTWPPFGVARPFCAANTWLNHTRPLPTRSAKSLCPTRQSPRPGSRMLSHAHAGFLSEPVTPHERQPSDSLNYHTRDLLVGLRVPDPLALRSLLRSGRLKEAKAGAFLGLPRLHSTFYFDRTTLLDIRRLVLPNAPLPLLKVQGRTSPVCQAAFHRPQH